MDLKYNTHRLSLQLNYGQRQNNMLRILIIVALCWLFSCATSVPPMPHYQTDQGQECGRDCQIQYSGCMKNEIRPDFLLFSPRNEACQKMLRGCYNTCLDKDVR